MKINVSPYDETSTDSIINMIRLTDGGFESYFSVMEKYYFTLRFLKLPSSLQFFKKVFGKQKITKNYSRRNWIWTFTDENKKGVLYCLISKEGLSWEYDLKSDENVVRDLFKEVNEHLIVVSTVWSKAESQDANTDTTI